MSYLAFVLQERKVLSFGLSFTFFSSFGQTFLISLFVPFFLADFNLSNAAFGTLYSAATLSSALLLPYVGRWIDVLPISKYSFFVAVGLMVAAIVMSLSWHISLLFVALLMLRLSGQGLSGHTAETAMARHYHFERGKALSVSALGYPMGEAVLPLAVAALLAVMSWRATWGVVAVVIALAFIPFILVQARRAGIDNLKGRTGAKASEPSGVNLYRTIISERRFWMIMPAVILPPFWITALFLYQVSIAEQLGWTAAVIASAFVLFASVRIASSIGVGPLIDKLGASRIYPFYLIPFAVGLFVAFLHPGLWSAFLYMALIGVTMGVGSTAKSALWAELYGPEVIGTVRSLFASVMVFSTAISPFLMGWMLDYHVPMQAILLAAITTFLAGTVLAYLGLRQPE